ncbi:hypothetical protein [Amycolatopsis mediterranei]|nr:hypothetical protein [Amycolatopsis mediterranei]
MTGYDAIADWYETTLVPSWRADPLLLGLSEDPRAAAIHPLT